jgi:hypothetical protein
VVGVTHYAGRCKVFEYEERERIEVALLARLGYGDLTTEYPGLGKYSLKQHEQECLPQVLEGEGVVANA